jgi:hypothetical protein
MKLRCQLFSTWVLGTARTARFVPHRLTVLLSYQDVAPVPLLGALVKWKMATVRMEFNRSEGGNAMTSAYASWVGQAVILQVAAGDLRVPLRGIIVGESDGAVRFRIGDTWDIDIYKPMILAVEQDNWASLVMN